MRIREQKDTIKRQKSQYELELHDYLFYFYAILNVCVFNSWCAVVVCRAAQFSQICDYKLILLLHYNIKQKIRNVTVVVC